MGAKHKSSPFWWFMRHHQKLECDRTGRSPSMGQLSQTVGSKWKGMSAAEKQPFIDKHEEYKKGPRYPLTDYTPSRRPKAPMVKEEPGVPPRPESRSSVASSSLNIVQQLTKRKKTTLALLKFIEATEPDKLMKTKFYTISSNVMCATRKELDGCIIEDTYLPLEVSIAEFTMADGITKCINKFLDPGPIPENMARICNDHGQKHLIPLIDFSLAIGCCKNSDTQEYIQEERQREYDHLVCDLHDFLVNSIIDEMTDSSRGPVKLLFSQADQIFQNQGSLKTIGDEAGYNDFVDNVEILDVMELFFFLCRKKGFRLKALLMDLLESTKYNFDGRCEYHEEMETAYCATTVAKKYCWLMFEKLSELYDFKLTSQHKPIHSKTMPKVIEEASSFEWGGEPEPIKVPKRFYLEEEERGPKRPVKLARGSEFSSTDAIGRGRSTPRDPRPSNVPVFASTDIRERERMAREAARSEPEPGPSRMDFRPRLPGAEPVARPFIQVKSEDTKPIFRCPSSPPSAPTPPLELTPTPTTTPPDTTRTLGRGRRRN